MDKKELRKAKNSARKCIECAQGFTKHQVKLPLYRKVGNALERRGFICAPCLVHNADKYGVVEL